jgi:hypothetical protein
MAGYLVQSVAAGGIVRDQSAQFPPLSLPERTVCSPTAIIAEVVSLMQIRAKERRLSLEAEFYGPIPELIQTDPIRVRQILINLVGNAIKFTEAGGVRLVTRFLEDASGCRMQFDVMDTRIGMAVEHMTRLFEPFTQADASTTRRFGGTGLGLAISKRLAKMLTYRFPRPWHEVVPIDTLSSPPWQARWGSNPSVFALGTDSNRTTTERCGGRFHASCRSTQPPAKG